MTGSASCDLLICFWFYIFLLVVDSLHEYRKDNMTLNLLTADQSVPKAEIEIELKMPENEEGEKKVNHIL